MKKMRFDRKRSYMLFFLVEIIALLGVLFVYSASSYISQVDYGNKFYFAQKQLVGVVLGSVAMLFTAKFDYYKYKKISLWFFVISIALLLLVFVPLFSVEIYGAKRWIRLGFFTIQPSEIAKFSYILFVATYFSKKPERAYSFKGFIFPVLLGALLCLTIILEPNMSITVCVGTLMISLLFCAGVKLRYLLVILVPILVCIPVLIIIEPYRLSRLNAFLNPWSSPQGEGYQLIQSLYALGNGGFFGVGLFNSRQKYRFLPFAESDFILSIIGEELGFFGVFVLFLTFFAIIIYGIITAKNARNIYSYLLAVGITMIYAIQVLVNSLVVTGSIPPTGLPLPLISSGNTSIIMYMAGFGVLQNIANDNKRSLLI